MPVPPAMVKNESDQTLGLDKDGNVVEGDANPAMVTLLVAPGGQIGQDVIDKHQLGDRLKAKAKPAEPDPKILESVQVRKPLLTEDEAKAEALREKPPEPAEKLADTSPQRVAGDAAEAAESNRGPFQGKGPRR